jgi:hypothetical protein
VRARRRIVLPLLILGPFLLVPPASAGDVVYQTKTYHIANGAGGLSSFGVNVGGIWFQGPGDKTLSRATAQDTNGSPVRLRVAQDLNNNFQYGDPGEPSVSGCGTVDLSKSSIPFESDEPVAVFVSIAYTGCIAAGTTGTVTLFVSDS